MIVKKWLQRLFIFVFIFAFVFGDFANTGVFSKGTLQVQAADTIKDYKETGHKLHSNTDMGAVAIDEVGHKSTTPFRKFVMDDADDGNKRVICGYAVGRGHPGDTYTKKVVFASNWKSTKSNDAEFIHNTTAIAKGLCWFYEDVKPSNATERESYFIQTYVWAESMGKNVKTALTQLAASKGWNYQKKILPLYNKVKKRKVEGYVVVYRNTKCKDGNTITHQPYFRWVKTKPEYDTVTAKETGKVSKEVSVEVTKTDSTTKKAISGAKFKATTKDVDGKALTVNLTTGSNGKASSKVTRTFSAQRSAEKKYVTNWDKLTEKQKEKCKNDGNYPDKSLAQAAAKKEAAKNAADEAAKAKANFSANWKIEEVSVPNHIIKVNGKVKSVTKKETGNTVSISYTFSDTPKYGSISLYKTCKESYSTDLSLEGAVYTVYNKSSCDKGTEVSSINISKQTENGKTVYKGNSGRLTAGTYWVKETWAPNGFEKDSEAHKFILYDNGTSDTLLAKEESGKTITSLTSNEEAKKGTVTITKYVNDLVNETGIKPEKGIEFTLKAVSKFSEDTPYTDGVAKTTAQDGTASWEDVPYGYYTLTLTSKGLPKNMTKVGPFSLHIEDDTDANKNDIYSGRNIVLGKTSDSGETVDELLPCSVTIHKVMSKTELSGTKTYHPEKGAKFAIYDTDGNMIGKPFTTNENGYAKSAAIKAAGSYVLKQIEGTASYKFMEDKPFTVTEEDLGNEDGTATTFEYTVDNTYQGDRIYLDKYKVAFDQDREEYDEEGRTVEPDAGFAVMNVSSISKADLADLRENGEDWTQEERNAFVQKYADAVLATMQTDEAGKASVDIDCVEDMDGRMHSAIGEDGFVIVQTSGTTGYYLSGPIFSADLKRKDNEGSMQWSGEKNNYQEINYGIATFKKFKTKDEKTVEPEAGAQFKVLKNDGTYLKDPDKKEVICEADKEGKVSIPWLLPGVYSLKQTDGSKFHEKLNEENNEDAVFVVREDDCVFSKKEMTAFVKGNTLTKEQEKHILTLGDEDGRYTDKELPISLSIEKHSTHTGVLLKDAEFTLYQKEGDNWKELGKYYTGDGKDGTEIGRVTVKGLSFGTYKIKETKAPAGYLLSEEDTGKDSSDPDFPYQEKVITIDADHVAETDGELVFRANKSNADSAYSRFNDSPIYGRIRINKTGNVMTGYASGTEEFTYKDTGVAGAVYALYAGENIMDDAGNVIWKKDEKIDEVTTDSKGYADFTNKKTSYTKNFFMGHYYIKETKAPDGFDVDTETHEVVLTWDAGAKDLDIGSWQPDDENFKEQPSHGDYFLCTGEQLNPYIVNAQKVIFTYEKAPASAKAVYDISADRVGTKANPTPADSKSTVVLWQDPEDEGTFYVSTQTTKQEVKFNKISSSMFYKCQKLRSVIFHHVDTSNMIHADKMFSYCTKLTSLNLSNWETGSLNSTVGMFANSGVLKKIYVGDTDQKVPNTEPTETGIYTVPKQEFYLYTDPDTEDEETLAARKLTADSFNYALCYSDGEGESITDLTDDDIASISPEYPTFADDKSKRSGKLEVTIQLKESSPYYAKAEDGGEGHPGILKVTIDVKDPATLKLDPKVDEHPETEADVEDTQRSISLSLLKIDAAKKGAADAEDSGLSATFKVYAATDLKSYDGKTIIKEGDFIKTIKSIDKDTDDGGRAGMDKLPIGYYTVNPDAKNLYKIVEVIPPRGYSLYPQEEKNTAYIPNIDYLNLSSNEVVSKVNAANPDTISATYNLAENTYTFALTFSDIKTPTITKNWGEEKTQGFVKEEDRPNSLTIHMYTDKEKTNLYKTITLTKEKGWIYAFDDDIDLSKYYYEEVVPDDAVWKKDTREYEDGYFKDSETNCVTFYNWEETLSDEPVIPSVTKYWEDNDNAPKKRPKEIKVNLLQNGVVLDDYSTVLNESNNWTFTVKEDKSLPKYDDVGREYVYTWEEDTSGLPKDYELTDTKTTTSSDSQYTYIHTDLTNTYAQYTSAQIAKSWNDEENLYNLRPDSVTVHLLADGERVEKLTLEQSDGTTTDITDGNVVLSEKNNWSAKTINLPKYKGSQKIEYTWEEEDVPDYELSSNVTVTKDADSVTERTETSLINKSNPRLGSVSVSKMIPVESLDLRHGDLSFTFTITGETVHEKEYTDKQTVTFTKNTVSDEDNVITINGKKYLVLFVSFDDLDWGDYKITESGSESRYEFNKISDLENATAGKEEDGTPYIAFTVDKDHQDFGGTFENAAISSSIKVIKRGNSKTKKLKGVTFKIEKILADKKTELVATKETDENGEILFDNLDPGDYVLTETKTLPGYTLMKDSINVTVPMALTTKEAEDMKADTSKGKYDKAKDLYYFYDLTYDVDNEKTPTPPLTGGFENWLSYLPIVLAMALFIGLGIYQMKKRKKPIK